MSDKHDEIFEQSRQKGTYYKTSSIEEFVEKLISYEKLMPIEILHSSQDFVLTGILAFLFVFVLLAWRKQNTNNRQENTENSLTFMGKENILIIKFEKQRRDE
ncbi:hypothetical protein [Parageobacillus toebii]|uniref:hypothetical protein n=1 Tax=Parageobacillus toebii TaxID=153151 RepID=UPI0020D24AFE|nr:hypothetical protein [Parageobacillus toebii]